MRSFRNVRRFLTPTVCMVLLLSVGCGGQLVQVSGRVAYSDGGPVEGAIKVINFVPTDGTTAAVRKAGTGEIQDDGTFKLRRRKPGDGVYKGEYAVTFTVLKDPRTGESLIDRKYSRKNSTPFTVQIDSDQDDLVFELERMRRRTR